MKKIQNSSKRFLIAVIVLTVISFALSGFLSIWGNPEVVFWSKLMGKKDQDLQKMSSPKIIFIGGSSCTFSIDPEIVSGMTNRPSYNYGGSAFMGARYIFERSKSHIKKGDVLVVGFEPEILMGLGGEKRYPLGYRMAFANQELEMISALRIKKNNMANWADALRPGLRNTVVMLGRKLKGGREYAYSFDDWKGGGRLELQNVEYRLDPRGRLDSLVLDQEAIDFLSGIVDFCDEQGAECVYTIPWQGTEKEYVKENRGVRSVFMEQVAKVMPVIPDQRVGVISGMKGFSDSEYHLGEELSEKRSAFLGEKIKSMIEGQ